MFRALAPGSMIDLPPGKLVVLHRSGNTPDIAIGRITATPCRATIMGFALSEGNYRAYVYLASTAPAPGGRRTGLLFSSEQARIRFDDLDKHMAVAMEMVAAQGFVMQKMEYQVLSPDERRELVSELPFIQNARTTPSPGSAGVAPSPPLPPVGPPQGSGMFQIPQMNRPEVRFVTGQFESSVDISREISLPSMQAVETLARILSLF